MATIRALFFAVCVICIVGGTTLSIAVIWNVVENEELVLKALMTLGVVFLGSFLGLMVGRLMPKEDSHRAGQGD